MSLPRRLALAASLVVLALPIRSDATPISPFHVVSGGGAYFPNFPPSGLTPSFSIDAVIGPIGTGGGVVTTQTLQGGPIPSLQQEQALITCASIVSDPFPLIHTLYANGPGSLGKTVYITVRDEGTGGLDRVSISHTFDSGPCGAPPLGSTATVLGQVVIGP